MKDILRENGNIKAKVTRDKYGDELYAQRDGHFWAGITLSPVLARLMIEVLQQYLRVNEDAS